MPRSGEQFPSLRRHRATGLAVVTLRSPHGSTRDYYLGSFGSDEAQQRYQQLIATWFAMGRQLPDPKLKTAGEIPLTIADLSRRYQEHADTYYRHPDGTETGEADNIRMALRFLGEKVGSLHPGDLTPNRLRDFQQHLIRKDHARTYVNSNVRRVKSMFKWAEAREWVPPATYARLQTVEMLKAGRSAAREPVGLGPVDDAVVAATLPFLNRQVAGLVRFMQITGARCGEAVQLATRHVDMSNPIWEFKPPIHKCRHHGQARSIFIGQQAQEVLTPFVQLDPARRWFRPCDAERERAAVRRAARKTPLWLAHLRVQAKKRKQNPAKAPGESYDTLTVAHVIRAACVRAGIKPAWSPHRLRHAALSRIRAQYGIEAAAAIGGHSVLAMTDHYTATLRERLAREIVGKLG